MIPIPTNTKVRKVPYDAYGAIMHTVTEPEDEVPGQLSLFPAAEWRENKPFKATLTVEGIDRKKSSFYFVLVDTETKAGHPMFAKDMVEMLPRVTIERGTVTAWWIGIKRGKNYGIGLYSPIKHQDREYV